ncbi:hypothetical protein [Mycolicibacterium porcinum]|uniref:hypothetical protein n=1 Tax=Mycolicibacterium porcinum TaxID=39693 RepID=UPI0010425D53|nr:hypothetical protein [Mycolicibacterium porcinum]
MTTLPTPDEVQVEVQDKVQVDPSALPTLDEVLSQYSIVRYDNPNGLSADSENDWREAKAAIERVIALREQLAYELGVETINVASIEAEVRQETEKAYGGCRNCYGKGYATQKSEVRARGMRWDTSGIKFCDCERGKQLQQLIERKEDESA